MKNLNEFTIDEIIKYIETVEKIIYDEFGSGGEFSLKKKEHLECMPEIYHKLIKFRDSK